jgi:hypothetical protein
MSESDAPQERGGALQRLLAPVPVERFLRDTFGTNPLHLTGESGRCRSLLDWDGLARLMELPLEPPRLNIIKGGKVIPGERYLRLQGGISRIDGGALSLLLDAGATAVINHVDDLLPAVAQLADETGDRLSARTAVNLYATWRSEHGFDPHWDYHDVIVLQLAGRKQWPVFNPTRSDPLRGDPFEAPAAGTAPDQVFMLENGDVLYLPRGWIHAPATAGEPSLHLTIAITRPTGAGFLEWLAKELREDPEVRAALPLAGEDSSLAEWKQGMTAIVARAIEAGAVDRFQTQKDAERGARPHFSFPDFGRIPSSEWNEKTGLRPASMHRLLVETDGEGIGRLTAMGRTWPCSPAVASALRRVTSTRPLALGDLESGLDPSDAAQLRELLALLATMGLLAAEAS